MGTVTGRGQLVLAAERLVAERGVEVPLRDIAVAAGQRNNSAVHYHFGSREGLFEAVLGERLAPVNAAMLARLADLEATGGAEDVRSLVDVLVTPMATEPYAAGSTHYARFLEQVRARPLIAQLPVLAPEHSSATRLVLHRLGRALAGLPEGVRGARLRAMSTAMFALLSDLERDRESAAGPPEPAAVDDVVDMLVGLLLAPARAE
jgi:AcrR family transcriptional regulator